MLADTEGAVDCKEPWQAGVQILRPGTPHLLYLNRSNVWEKRRAEEKQEHQHPSLPANTVHILF